MVWQQFATNTRRYYIQRKLIEKVCVFLFDKLLELLYNNYMNMTDNDNIFEWAYKFSNKMTKLGEKMSNMADNFTSLFDETDNVIQNCSIQGDITGDNTSVITSDGVTIIKKGKNKITIDKDGNVTVNGKKVEHEKKPKYGDLEKLADVPKIDDSDLFRNTVDFNIPTKARDEKNLTTPLTLADLDKYELKLTELKIRIEKLLTAVIIIGLIALTSLVSICLTYVIN